MQLMQYREQFANIVFSKISLVYKRTTAQFPVSRNEMLKFILLCIYSSRNSILFNYQVNNFFLLMVSLGLSNKIFFKKKTLCAVEKSRKN